VNSIKKIHLTLGFKIKTLPLAHKFILDPKANGEE